MPPVKNSLSKLACYSSSSPIGGPYCQKISLFHQWNSQGGRRQGRSQSPPPRSWPGLIGPGSGWRKEDHTGGRWLQKPAHPVNLAESFDFFFHFACCLCLLPMVLLRLLNVLQGLHQLHLASHLWWEAQQLKAHGLQRNEFAVAGSKAGDLYDILKAAMTPEALTSGDLPSCKRHRHMPSTVVLDPTARVWDYIFWPDSPRVQGGMLEQGALPHPIKANIPTEMVPIGVNISDTQWVYCCQAEGHSEGPPPPAPPCAPMCAVPIWAQSPFFNSYALMWQCRWPCYTTFSCPRKKTMLLIFLKENYVIHLLKRKPCYSFFLVPESCHSMPSFNIVVCYIVIAFCQ